MNENTLLVAFLLLPHLTGGGAWWFFRWRRGRQRTLAALIAGNGLILMFLVSLMVVGGEIYFRFVFDETDSFGLTKTTRKWFERHEQMNAVGVRDSIDYRPKIAPGKRRVTFLGDSFTVGHGVPDVEQRFVNRVRAARPGEEVQMLARNGLDTGPEVNALAGVVAVGYQLDTVVLVYCLNDIADLVPEWQGILRRIYAFSRVNFLVEHSYFFNALYFHIRVPRDPELSGYYRFVHDNYEGPIWETQQGRLRQLRDGVRAAGGRLVVVTFPFLHELGPDYRYADVHTRLDELWKSLGVPHLDLLPVFTAHESADLVVNGFDAHPNEFAHGLAADAIGKFLDSELAD
jgi:lysophospholipase L1-like esterase